jgi:sugar phosphate isomerase/epimerase
MQSRRNFLQIGAAAMGSSLLLSGFVPPKKKKKPESNHISVQLYSVRDDMKKDALGTLKQLSAMGYREIEPANYMSPEIYQSRLQYGYSAKEFRKICDDLGLKITSSHVVFPKDDWNASTKEVSDSWKHVMEDANIMGQKYLISPWFAFDKKNLEDVRKGFEVYNNVGMATAKSGLRFGFHNHHEEFDLKFNDVYLYDIMLKELDLKYVCQQLDICNMSVANVDPMRWLKMFPKHFELMHVKDRSKTTTESTHLGEGALKMHEILDFARKNTNIKYWVIEQEAYQEKTPLECVKFDLEKLKTEFKFA